MSLRPNNLALVLCALILSLMGILFIFTASSVPAAQKYHDLFFLR